jgi:hypothetical protein
MSLSFALKSGSFRTSFLITISSDSSPSKSIYARDFVIHNNLLPSLSKIDDSLVDDYSFSGYVFQLRNNNPFNRIGEIWASEKKEKDAEKKDDQTQ